jgi:D-aminopeptidase
MQCDSRLKAIGATYALAAALLCSPALAESPPERARALGVPFSGTPGPLNAITDVPGVEVGQVSLIPGDRGAVRTGVTAILPRGRTSTVPVFAGWFALNGAGEMTGTTWLQERGFIDGPVMITNTHSVGVVRDAAVAWMVRQGWKASWQNPVAAETYDGFLNDINGFHVTKEDAWQALDAARAGPVAEGAVGGGTGMVCNEFKGGTGTASRVIPFQGRSYTVGVLVQCNYGRRADLRLGGVAFGERWADRLKPCVGEEAAPSSRFPRCAADPAAPVASAGETPDGSIIVVVATDAPLLPHQLMRLAKRPALGIGRLGAIARDGSGDLFLAFSTANPGLASSDTDRILAVDMFPNEGLSPLFGAAVEATEEAVVNSMTMARTMTGAEGRTVYAIPRDDLAALFGAAVPDPKPKP